MNKLSAELQRLYFLPHPPEHRQPSGEPTEAAERGALRLVSPDGRARALVVGFERGTDWEAVAKLYQGVQEDLDLPAPALSVSGKSGYQLWFSLAESAPLEEIAGFLEALRLKFLADLPLAHLHFRPAPGASASAGQSEVDRVPALHEATGKWSAFIDPGMGSMFSTEPGLEMAPHPDRQADLLAWLESIQAQDFRRARALLQPPAPAAGSPSEGAAAGQNEEGSQPGSDAGRRSPKLHVGSDFSDPKSFLLAVMNDPSASAGQRIKAAKALLPYFDQFVPPQASGRAETTGND